MYDGGKIMAGLAIFVLLLLSPFIYNLIVDAETMPEPDLDTPIINALKKVDKAQCIESAEWMRGNHMQLLMDWRDLVVREGQRKYTNSSGREFNASLQNTCLHCHSNKEKFCDKCHNYLAVDPYCWDCHVIHKQEGAL